MLNKTLDNRYTILEHVGGGGMADVYRAHDQLLDRSVAVKILRSQLTNDEDFVNGFRREAQAAARLSHPNIVNIHDVGRDNDVYYIVMEYISGQTLKGQITNEPLSIEAAVKIAVGIAEGLEHAHQNNLIHCDIKPQNILMTSAGRIKVTDFGIARVVSSATMTNTGTIMGSVHYFSPEQAKGVAIDAKSDIYSLGVVLYEMLTGEVPFNGETSISIALKHLQEEPRSLRDINAKIPPLLEDIVLKAMAKDAAHRFRDISEMINELKSVQNYSNEDHTLRLAKGDFPTQVLPKVDEKAHAKTSTLSGPKIAKVPVKEPKKRRLWVWGLLVLLLIGFAVGAFLFYGKFSNNNEITIPNIVGKQSDIARNILVNKNLRVDISEAFSDNVPAGNVISQYPEAGAAVKEQLLITMVVSKGEEIKSPKPTTVDKVPDALTADDFMLNGIRLGDSAKFVIDRLGEPQKRKQSQDGLSYVYKDMEVIVDSQNTVVNIIVDKSSIPTHRNISVGVPLKLVNSRYGEPSVKTSFGNYDLYEYVLPASPDKKYILRFAIKHGTDEVNYIGCRISVP